MELWYLLFIPAQNFIQLIVNGIIVSYNNSTENIDVDVDKFWHNTKWTLLKYQTTIINKWDMLMIHDYGKKQPLYWHQFPMCMLYTWEIIVW